MKIDITQLLIIFDKLLPATNEEQGYYWFRTIREDGIIVDLSFSIYDSRAGVSVYNNPKTAIASVDLETCSEIRVLDEKRKCLELLHSNGKGRCFIALQGDSVLEYSE